MKIDGTTWTLGHDASGRHSALRTALCSHLDLPELTLAQRRQGRAPAKRPLPADEEMPLRKTVEVLEHPGHGEQLPALERRVGKKAPD